MGTAAHEDESFIIPSRVLRGSKREMVGDIDQAIIGLLALRHQIDGSAQAPGSLAHHGRRRVPGRHWTRLSGALRPLAFWR